MRLWDSHLGRAVGGLARISREEVDCRGQGVWEGGQCSLGPSTLI